MHAFVLLYSAINLLVNLVFLKGKRSLFPFLYYDKFVVSDFSRNRKSSNVHLFHLLFKIIICKWLITMIFKELYLEIEHVFSSDVI